MTFNPRDLFSTYSIIARDPETGAIGGAVQTHQMSVGRIIPYMQAGVGVIASQSLANLRYNPMALTMLKQGIPPERIIDALIASDSNAQRRQVAVMNNAGQVAAFTGDGCIREFGHHIGDNYSVQANMMTKPTVIVAMAAAFESATGDLAARMMAALEAAQAEAGDIRGMQSAALKIVSGDLASPEWERVYDLRVDEHAQPVTELKRLVRYRYAQLIDQEGYQALSEKNLQGALDAWQRARDTAPEQEELAFWQAVTLADTPTMPNAILIASDIIRQAFAQAPDRQNWLDLIERITDNGLIQHDGVGAALLLAIKGNS